MATKVCEVVMYAKSRFNGKQKHRNQEIGLIKRREKSATFAP